MLAENRMGRKPTVNLNMPRHMRPRRQRSGKVFYYYDTGKRPRKEIPLGADYALALKKYAELEIDARGVPQNVVTFYHVGERYRCEIIPTKAPSTQHDNNRELDKIYEFFNRPPAPLESIKPIHIRQYLNWRRDAPVRANREVALFSHIWNCAREWGYTDVANPCRGIKRFKEHGRKDIYTEDEVLAAVQAVADEPLRDALDLAYLTGKRPNETLRLSESDIRDGVLHIFQSKTSKRQRMSIEGKLKVAIDRISARKVAINKDKKRKVRSLALVVNESGQKLRQDALRYRFDKARANAVEAAKKELAVAQTALEREKFTALIRNIQQFQFRDLRGKAGTDKTDESGDIRQAQKQLGHASVLTTEVYVRERRGDLVTPTK